MDKKPLIVVSILAVVLLVMGSNNCWGIVSIVEDVSQTELLIGNIRGPVGITANVYNIGLNESAVNVSWSITVSRGLSGVIVLKNGTVPSIEVNSSISIGTGLLIGFGMIHIKITAKAENAPEVIARRIAFLFGPFVIGIR